MEIESFNQLFAQSKLTGMKLDGFSEDAVGFFYARWRSSSGAVGPEIKRRLPFTACLDAYLACKAIVDEDSAGAEDDLFG